MVELYDYQYDFYKSLVDNYKLMVIGYKDKVDNMNSIETIKPYEPYEQDPNGLKPSDPGAKLDHGKPDLDLVLGDFSRALVEVGRVGTFGANKYSRSGWLSVPDAKGRYKSALLRHYFYEKSGEDHDPESNLLHAAHLAWNSLAYLELLLREIENEYSELYYTYKKSIKGSDT